MATDTVIKSSDTQEAGRRKARPAQRACLLLCRPRIRTGDTANQAVGVSSLRTQENLMLTLVVFQHRRSSTSTKQEVSQATSPRPLQRVRNPSDMLTLLRAIQVNTAIRIPTVSLRQGR